MNYLAKFSNLLILKKGTAIVCADIVLFCVLIKFLPVEEPINEALALLIFVAVLWLTQAISIVVTSLLIPVLASALGILTVKSALASFADPVIFLFLGGFALAAALHKQGLDEAIVQRVMILSKGSFLPSCLLLFASTAFISMWISNTATTAMMLPLALGMLTKIDFKQNRNTYLFILLGVAYSANIGGLATVLGSPPNAIATGILNLSFIDWFKIGLPTSITLLILLILLLLIVLKPNRRHVFEVVGGAFKYDRSKIILAVIFALTVSGWLFSKPLSAMIGIDREFDSFVAVSAIVILCFTKVVRWRDIEKHTAWGVLLLFGGGITLSHILSSTGASAYLVDLLSFALLGVPMWIVILLIITFVVFFTELASNTATGALMIPLFMIMAEVIGFPPGAMAIAVALSATCAFMLPVATPPNAIVYGSGYIRAQDMLRLGFLMNLISIAVLTIFSLTLYQWVFS